MVCKFKKYGVDNFEKRMFYINYVVCKCLIITHLIFLCVCFILTMWYVNTPYWKNTAGRPFGFILTMWYVNTGDYLKYTFPNCVLY